VSGGRGEDGRPPDAGEDRSARQTRRAFLVRLARSAAFAVPTFTTLSARPAAGQGKGGGQGQGKGGGGRPGISPPGRGPAPDRTGVFRGRGEPGSRDAPLPPGSDGGPPPPWSRPPE